MMCYNCLHLLQLFTFVTTDCDCYNCLQIIPTGRDARGADICRGQLDQKIRACVTRGACDNTFGIVSNIRGRLELPNTCGTFNTEQTAHAINYT